MNQPPFEPCWGYHASSIPADTAVVIDDKDERWFRAGPRSWRPHSQAPGWDGPRFHESWLLEQSMVRCPAGEQLLGRREDQLAELLGDVDGVVPNHVPMPDTDAVLPYPEAMDLMRAGWMAWTPKQRREALA